MVKQMYVSPLTFSFVYINVASAMIMQTEAPNKKDRLIEVQ